MPQVQRSEVQSINFRCRFETAANVPPSDEFCAFDFPGCEACPKALHAVRSVRSSEDPMKAEVWHAWIARVAHLGVSAPTREVDRGEVHSPGELGLVQETPR
jgi:hypothetical protein